MFVQAKLDKNLSAGFTKASERLICHVRTLMNADYRAQHLVDAHKAP